MRKPNLNTQQTQLSATVGTDNRTDISASLNIPLIQDKLGLLISGTKNDQDGYMKLLDASGNDTGLKGNGTHRYNLRAALRYLPTNNLTLDLAADYTDDRSGIQALTPMNCTSLPTQLGYVAGSTIGSYVQAQISAGQFVKCPLYYGNEYTAFVGPYSPNDPKFVARSISATANWDVGFGTIRSITGNRNFSDIEDIALYGAPPPITQVNLRQATKQNQFQQEFQFISPKNEKFNYQAGIFFFREELNVDYATQVGTLATVPYHNDDHQIATSLGIYGELYYRPIPKLEVTLGGRYSQDTKEVERALYQTPPYTTAFATYNGNIKDDDFSPRLSVSYDTGPALVYATYSEGYRPKGFINTSPNSTNLAVAVAALAETYEKEKEKSFEVGFKTNLFDRKLSWNADYFAAKYDNFEATLSLNGNTIAVTSDADISGFESELNWRPTKDLTFFLNSSILDTKYTEPPAGQYYAVELKHAPKYTHTLGGNYNWRMASVPGSFFAGFDATWSAKAFRNVANTVSNEMDAYHLLTARAGYKTEDGNWTITAGGTNLTNTKYWLLSTQNRANAYQAPRRYYVTIATKF